MTEHMDLGLDEIMLESFEEGRIFRDVLLNEHQIELYFSLKVANYIQQEISAAYKESGSAVNQEALLKICKRHMKVKGALVDDMMKQMGDKFIKVESKKVLKDGSIVVKFVRADLTEQRKLITKIAKRLAKKIPPEMIVNILKDSIADDFESIDKLQRLEEISKKEKVKVEGVRGCYNFIFDDDIVVNIRG